jgi:hypothetical protein
MFSQLNVAKTLHFCSIFFFIRKFSLKPCIMMNPLTNMPALPSMQTKDQNPSSDMSAPGWVWRCTDESIIARKVSVLAIAEIVAAMFLFWWLIWRFNWAWMAFGGIIAAPMLLLRSEQSVAQGVGLLQTYWNGKDQRFGKKERCLIGVSSILVTGLVLHWFSSHWLPGNTGWALFWRIVVMITVAIAILVATVGAFSVAFSKSFSSALTFSVKFAGRGVVVVAFAGAVVLSFAVAHLSTNEHTDPVAILAIVIPMILFIPFLPLGILLRGFAIRLFATLQNPIAGLAQLPQNWRESLFTIDFLHPPELLPQASLVDKDLSVKGLWATRKKYFYLEKIFFGILLLSLYLPAIAYRWSLKATAWFWFPLALSLTPQLAAQDTNISDASPGVFQSWYWHYVGLAAVIMVWMFSGWLFWLLPSQWRPLLPAELATLASNLPSPTPFGLLTIIACIAVILTVVFIYRTKTLRASYNRVFKSSNGFARPDQQKGKYYDVFIHAAKKINRIRLLLILAFWLWCYGMVFGMLYQYFPALSHFTWSWLPAIL